MKKNVAIPRLVARRTDGLGQRIYALVNAKIYSKVLGVPFGFTWTDRFQDHPSHAIRPVGEVFSQSFIDNHLFNDDELPLRRYEEMPYKEQLSVKELAIRLKSKKFGWIVDNTRLENIIDKESQQGVTEWFSEAFFDIKFSDEVNEAIIEAKKVNLSKNTVALHLRSGDVGHGEFRHWGRFIKKIIPSAVANLIVEEYCERGYEVLLFGQEATNYPSFQKNKNVKFAENFYPSDFSVLQKAFFDIVLMSRCETITCGESGFAIIASLINGKRPIKPLDVFEREILLRRMSKQVQKDELLLNDAIQLSTSYWFMWSYLRKLVERDTALSWLERCAEYDTTNSLYHYRMAVHHIEDNNFAEAEHCMTRVACSENFEFDEEKFLERVYITVRHSGTIKYDKKMFLRIPKNEFPILNKFLLSLSGYNAFKKI